MDKRFLYLLVISVFFPVSLTSASEETHYEKEWGIGLTVRTASIPFDTKGDTVSSLVPMMFFQNDYFYIKGLEAGAYLYSNEHHEFNAITRMRFFDIPFEYQNEVQGDTFDFGGQYRYRLDDSNAFSSELMTDLKGNPYLDFGYVYNFESTNWDINLFATARYKSASFNSRYYALEDQTEERIGAGTEFIAKAEGRYHLYSNLYLLGSAAITALDSNTRHAEAVDSRFNKEISIGFAFFNDKSKQPEPISTKAYWRIAHGWATPSNIGEIIGGDSEEDPHNNQLTSVFYGHPLTDQLFGLPLDIYLTPGFVWHWSSDVQSSIQEYVIAIKAYYTLPLPWRIRAGVAEGLSYVSEVTYIERTEMEKKDYRPSELMNYLDFSLDINLGDVFSSAQLKNTWLGYSIHHRSSIFETAQQFGRIKGGSNYNSVYLQFNF
jgi:outer membrane protein